MIHALVESLSGDLLQKLPPNRAYDREALRTDALPPSIRHFLRRTLQEQVEHEMTRLHQARTNWVNYEASAVQEAQEELVRAAGQNAHVPADKWEPLLQQAVRQTGAYLIQPRDTLTRFVFSERNTASARYALQRLQFFSAYSYFPNVLSQYVEQRNIESFDAERFDQMLGRIDRKMTGDYTPAQWTELLGPLYTFTDYTPEGPDHAVPVPLLHTFFEEKRFNDITTRLQQAQASNVRALTLDELRQLLEASRGSAPPEREKKKPNRQPPPETSRPPQQGPVPLWKQFQPGERGGTPKKKGSSPTSQPAPSDPPDGETSTPRWQQFQGNSSSSSSSSPDALEHLEQTVLSGRGKQNRTFFVNNLFERSREDYRDTLRQLRDADTWSQAQKIVAREVFRKHNVNIYSDAAVSFTDAVQQRFR